VGLVGAHVGTIFDYFAQRQTLESQYISLLNQQPLPSAFPNYVEEEYPSGISRWSRPPGNDVFLVGGESDRYTVKNSMAKNVFFELTTLTSLAKDLVWLFRKL